MEEGTLRNDRGGLLARRTWSITPPPEITAILDSSNEPALTNLVLVAASPEWEVPLRGVRDRHLETYSRLSVTNVV